MTFFAKTLIREEEALGLLTLMIRLIKSYGPPQAPKVPSPLRPAPQLSDIFKSDFNSQPISDWAEDVFTQIKSDLGMESWRIKLQNDSNAFTPPMDICPQNPGPYSLIQPYIDNPVRDTTITFEPEQCHIPGYFVSTVILQLAELKGRACSPAADSQAQRAKLTLTSAAHSGQGFRLLPLKKQVLTQLKTQTPAVRLRRTEVQNTLLFTACLGLRALNRSPEQITAAYGCLVSPKVRQKIRLTCEQIDGFEDELDLLQRLCAPRQHRPLGKRHANVA